MDWCRVAIGPRRGEVSHLSTRGNMRSGSLYCDVRSSPRDTLNHLSPHPIQILAILEPDLRPSTFKFMGHIYLICQGLNNKISGTREVPWRQKIQGEVIFRMILYLKDIESWRLEFKNSFRDTLIFYFNTYTCYIYYVYKFCCKKFWVFS